jgi:hypothetical protein
MNWLPIVDRELRVAARKRSTFWLRVAAAATGLLIGAGCLLISRAQGVGTAELGSVLFSILTWMCLIAGLAAGLFFTSDCLSEEKREGTLGLLFLTELRGYDVALGKLLATSLRGFYALLAVLPVLAITQLMGGVSGAEYWKSALALVNGLVVSLSAGMVVSALSRDSQKALAGTLLALVLLAGGGPLADVLVGWARHRGFRPVGCLSSPIYVLRMAGAWGRSPFWWALLANQLLGWGLLALACRWIPRTWQEGRKAGASAGGSWAYAWKFGGAGRRKRLRRKLMEHWPVTWLLSRECWQSRSVWAVAVVTAGGFAAVVTGGLHGGAWILWNYMGGLLTLVLYLWAASQASRFLVEARRNGLMELMLVSPLSERQIVAGQWRALLRMFGLPVLLLLGVQVGGAALSQISFQRIAAQAAAAASAAGTNSHGSVNASVGVTSGAGTKTSATVVISGTSGTNAWGSNAVVLPGGFRMTGTWQQVGMAAAVAVAAALSTTANLLALCWFGMWMGMTSKSANLATLKTILFVQVIPWFVIGFGTLVVVGLIMSRIMVSSGSAQPAAWLTWWPLSTAVLSASVAVAKDAGFIAWSRRRLHASLREQATRTFGGA